MSLISKILIRLLHFFQIIVNQKFFRIIILPFRVYIIRIFITIHYKNFVKSINDPILKVFSFNSRKKGTHKDIWVTVTFKYIQERY